MESTNELLKILKGKVLKEMDMKGVRFSNVIQDLYDLVSLYTNDPYFTFNSDQAQQLFTFLKNSHYDSTNANLKQDLRFINAQLVSHKEKSHY